MVKFDVLNRFSGKVQFTAEIDCGDNEEMSIKLGLAVKWAIKAGANLEGANLIGANLIGANLEVANLEVANLEVANLEVANLVGANLIGANLRGANLVGANLIGANLVGANLEVANLIGANLRGANLIGANLRGANLRGANLEVAGSDLKHIKSLNCERYTVNYISDVMQIGCERHAILDWWGFNDETISKMDGEQALIWWRKWKPILQMIIEASPAEPTGWVEKIEKE